MIHKQIQKIVEIVYSVDKVDFDQEFVLFLDLLEKNIDNIECIDVSLLTLQEAYLKKDYINFADILLYEIKPMISKE